MWNRFFRGPADWSAMILATLAALLVAAVLTWLIRRLVALVLARIEGEKQDSNRTVVIVPLRVISAAAFLVLFELLLLPAYELAGLDPRAERRLQPVASWLVDSGIKILIIALVAYGLSHFAHALARRFESDVKGTTLDALERAKRARTLGSVVVKFVTAVIASIAGLMILKELGLDITPVLTGAGIAGVALGLGGQALVRDIIAGFFLILENQVRVGDIVIINGAEGLIEEINLRTLVLRDIEGTVHVFPNGAITTLANRSKDYSYYVVDLSVSYREDPDRVADILRDVGGELRNDPGFAPFVLAPIEIMGVDAFTDSAITIKVRIKTVPLKQWDVGREFRKRLKKALDQHGIEIPFPERIVTVRDGGLDVGKLGV